MKLNETIIKIRVELQNSKIKKSGKNRFAGFEYFELADFLPKLNELMLENGVNDIFTIQDDHATLKLIKTDEVNEYKIPFKIFETPLNKSGQASMQDIQYLGALNTYYKRYLYLNAFGITDGEVIDSMNNDNLSPKDFENKIDTLQTQLIEQYIAEELTTEEGILKEFNKKALEELSFEEAEKVIKILAKRKEKTNENKKEVF